MFTGAMDIPLIEKYFRYFVCLIYENIIKAENVYKLHPKG